VDAGGVVGANYVLPKGGEAMTKMQFAFQGGGAKLGVLLAAAEAVYAQQKHLNFTISRV
jgi:hypothetical protein